MIVEQMRFMNKILKNVRFESLLRLIQSRILYERVRLFQTDEDNEHTENFD